ncbi:hypothetical protein ABID92_000417 [Frigoribacterium sp. PvP120]|uniref:hypothetical protein n=1 Tax=unclassified Frigoribacterium TaxID=2627005 RepID=UPI001AE5A5EE|nr:hypothetical protein [Frigoribacterium sp. PvP121]MBP1241755.1 hypothetical protein [Frigoribacterium sp. PvP121]
MAVDAGSASIVGSILLLIGVLVQNQRAAARARREVPAETDTASDVDYLARDLALAEYVDGRIAAATQPLRDEIADLRRQFGALRLLLRQTREAFREYIRQVRSTWGSGEEPPPIGNHIRELLAEDDLDGTFSTDEVRRMRDGTDLDPLAEGR